MLINLPGGGQYDTSNDPNATEFNGVRLHVPLALSRLTEFWRNKPNMVKLQSDYAAEMQALENAIWDVLTQRLLPYAAGVNLDTIGSIVGQTRGGLTDPQYRARIQARIRINRSFGTPRDIIDVLRLIDPAPFTYRDLAGVGFVVDYLSPTSPDVAAQIVEIVRETRAAGVRGLVQVPTDLTRGARYAWPGSGLNTHIGWGYTGALSYGGLWGSGGMS